jgi:cytochrome b involved in lipid metabolism
LSPSTANRSTGKDATDAFEDVGHSDEAREILANLLKGDLSRRVICHLMQR